MIAAEGGLTKYSGNLPLRRIVLCPSYLIP
jgi:hypothetical protein